VAACAACRRGLTLRTPRVSVLIPTFNRAALLKAAVASVLAQTFRDFEVVVVDDGSTDETAEVVRSFGDCVRYVPIPHAGPVRARNAGLESARGEYLCLLDSDDLYYAHKLALQVDFLDRHPDVVMVYTEFSAFGAAGFFEEYHLKSYHRSAYRSRECGYDRMFASSAALGENRVVVEAAVAAGATHWLERKEYVGRIFEQYLHDTIVFTNSMMLRRSVLDVVGLQNAYFGHFHDLEFALRIARAGPVGFIDNPTYKLRYHPEQVSSTTRRDGELTFVKLQRDLLRVARFHLASDRAFYERNRARADALIGRLCRAAAVPLLAYGGTSKRRRRSFARRARSYLRFAAVRGQRYRALWLISFLPVPLKRVYFAAAERWQRFGSVLGTVLLRRVVS
jgi:glycosyltransferase involved in cell wall biosynthesis